MQADYATLSIARGRVTSLAVLTLFLASTGWPAGQPELKFVLIVSRHGVRSPTWDAARLNEYSSEPWPDWGVPPGNLTAHGRTLMNLMGDYYRDLFKREGLFKGPLCADASRTYFRSDTGQRTRETGRALAESIFPACPVEVHSGSDGERDPLFDPIEAGLVAPDAALSLAAVAGRLGPKPGAVVEAHRAAFDLLNHVLTGNGRAARSIFDEPVGLARGKPGVSMSGPLNLASTLSEVFLLEYTEGMSGAKLGWGRVTAVQIQEMMSLHATYAELMRRTGYLAQARGSNLLDHVVRSLEQAMSRRPVRGALAPVDSSLAVIVGHDTNLSNLSGMLRLSWLLPSYQADDAPPGGALIFSLWQSPETTAYSVRLQFAAQTMDQMHRATRLTAGEPPAVANVFIPGCSGALEDYACSWSAFARVANAAIEPKFAGDER